MMYFLWVADEFVISVNLLHLIDGSVVGNYFKTNHQVSHKYQAILCNIYFVTHIIKQLEMLVVYVNNVCNCTGHGQYEIQIVN